MSFIKNIARKNGLKIYQKSQVAHNISRIFFKHWGILKNCIILELLIVLLELLLQVIKGLFLYRMIT